MRVLVTILYVKFTKHKKSLNRSGARRARPHRSLGYLNPESLLFGQLKLILAEYALVSKLHKFSDLCYAAAAAAAAAAAGRRRPPSERAIGTPCEEHHGRLHRGGRGGGRQRRCRSSAEDGGGVAEEHALAAQRGEAPQPHRAVGGTRDEHAAPLAAARLAAAQVLKGVHRCGVAVHLHRSRRRAVGRGGCSRVPTGEGMGGEGKEARWGGGGRP